MLFLSFLVVVVIVVLLFFLTPCFVLGKSCFSSSWFGLVLGVLFIIVWGGGQSLLWGYSGLSL